MTAQTDKQRSSPKNGSKTDGREATGRPQRLSDRELIRQFAHDSDQDAFRVLVERHGGLVYHVCWQILRHHQDAEDAFQATFLVLARAARRVRWQKSLANWLYAVAHRLALKSASRRCRIREEEPRDAASAASAADDPFDAIARRETDFVVHEELLRLPAKYPAPLLLCYLRGKSREDAAAELGCTPGTLKGRLERGRNRLRLRLCLRGVALPTAVAGSCRFSSRERSQTAEPTRTTDSIVHCPPTEVGLGTGWS